MKTERFEKVYIRSEADLPKEDGRFVAQKKSCYTPEYWVYEHGNDFMKGYWMENIDGYLQPITEPQPSRERVIEVLKK